MPCARLRPKMSDGPPAGKGMISLTGLVGYACPKTIAGNRASASNFSSFIRSPFRLIAAHRHPAVDHELGAGDEARFIGSKEKHGVRGIAPVAGEAERDALDPRFEQRLHVAARALLREPRLDH